MTRTRKKFTAAEKMALLRRVTVTSALSIFVRIAHVVVSPAADTLLVGTTRQDTVRMFDRQGNPSRGRDTVWSSSDPTRATVSGTGVITAIALTGTTAVTIAATSEGVPGSSKLTIAPNDTGAGPKPSGPNPGE